MKTKHRLFFGFAVLALAAVFILAGCDSLINKLMSDTYTVSFDPGEGTGHVSSQTVDSGKSITLPGSGGMIGPSGRLSFTGWKTGGQIYQPGNSYPVTSNVTFIAQWGNSGTNVPSSYTLTITESAWEMAETAKGYYTYVIGSTEVTLTVTHTWKNGTWQPTSPEPFPVTLLGDTLTGYDNNHNLITLTKVSSGSNPSNPFMGVWSTAGNSGPNVPGGSYTVSFSPGEGSGQAPIPQTVVSGQSIMLPGKAGMVGPLGRQYFTGWKITGQTQIYQEGNSYYSVTSNIIFTAQWDSSSSGTNVPEGTYTLTVTASGWEMLEMAKGSYTYYGNDTATFIAEYKWDEDNRLWESEQRSVNITLSGNTLTGYDNNGNPIMLTKVSGGSSSNPFVGTWITSGSGNMLVITDIPANVISYGADGQGGVGILPFETTTDQAFQNGENLAVAGADFSDDDVVVQESSDGTSTLILPLHHWTGSGTYDVYVYLYASGDHYYKANDVFFSPGITTIPFSSANEIFLSN
jgi:hypothetical protein